jgi:hypothetical protein
LLLAGADIGADERDQWGPEAEDDRDQQIFEARSGAEAGDGVDARGCSDESRREPNRDIGLHRLNAGDRADAKNVTKERPAQARPAEPNQIAPG